MDTGSEFAMVMTHMAKDTFKDGVEIIRMLLALLQKDVDLREKLLVDGFGLRQLSRTALNYEGIELSEEALEKFAKIAKTEKLKFAGLRNFENPESVKMVFDTADIERVNKIFEKIKEVDFERMTEEEIKEGIEDAIEYIQDLSEDQEVAAERQQDVDEFHKTFNDDIPKVKNKDREPER